MNKDAACVLHTHMHTHNGILVSHKNKILPFVTTGLDLEGIILSEMKTDPYCMISLMWNIKDSW